jgi:hypothetical protein
VTSRESWDQCILRTYSVRSSTDLDITFMDAALATCAAEPSFLPVTTGPHLRRQTYISGNISGVNTSKQLLSEAYALFGGSRRLSWFLSLGPGPIDILSLYPGGIKSEKEILMVSEAAIIDQKKVEREVATKLVDAGIYFRFTAAHFLQGNDKEVDLRWITTQTIAYLCDVEISRKMDTCVERCRLNRGMVPLEQIGILVSFHSICMSLHRQNHRVQKISYIKTFLYPLSTSSYERSHGK